MSSNSFLTWKEFRWMITTNRRSSDPNTRIGNWGEPFAEYIASGGWETTQNHMLLTRSKEADYTELWQLDVLDLEKRKTNDKDEICHEFKDQLGWSQERWYETSLLWKTNSDELQIANMAEQWSKPSRWRCEGYFYDYWLAWR